ncbi:MAG: hypothetical protein ACTSYZ_07075 [Candidatus Helarchaeota archaeon]
MSDKCPVCQLNSSVRGAPAGEDSVIIDCPRCGKFKMSGTAATSDFTKYLPRHLLSGIIRNRYENGEKVFISTNDFKDAKYSIHIPKDPWDYIDLLLEHIYRKSGKIYKTTNFNINFDYPLLFAENPEEFKYYVDKSRELGFIEPVNSEGYRLAPEGWKRIPLIKTKKNNNAFVAMWFDDSVQKAWEKGIKPAIKETGYNPIRIDLQEHNEKICDRIIAEIKKSSFMIADFTGQRGGVYFEAGFALGLGIPVIWTCRDDDFDNLHFDTRQYNHIKWATPDELKKKLINRIDAVIKKIP